MSNRAAMRERLNQSSTYDLVVIGGGITGCGVAYEAAARGAKVLVLEQSDFAIGTSSRSTKLIHGGIRYLKQMDFRLVREGVQERQVLIKSAPYLVHPVQFVYPVHAGDPDPLLALRLGLVLYDWFAGRQNLLPHQVFSAQGLLEQEPLLREDGLKGGALYADGLTDDARLTVEVARAAAQQDAVLINYMKVEQFVYDRTGRICGVMAQDLLGGGEPLRIEARVVLNAAGPWVDRVRRLDCPACRPVLRPTKGTHVAVAHTRLPVRRPVVMHATDGRLMFAVPRGAFTYLGTTDTDYLGDPAHVEPDRDDVAYILNATNRTFPAAHLEEADVVSAWSGLRPLAASSENAGPSQVSRDYRLHTSRSGLVSVAGGKLTAFQAMARAIVHALLPELPGQTVDLVLPGTEGEADQPLDWAALAGEFHLSEADLQELWSRHGGQFLAVLDGLDPRFPAGRVRMLAAEAAFAAQNEFAVSVSDVLSRRTAQLLFSPDNGTDAAPAVAGAMGEILGWDRAEREAQVAAYQAEVAAMNAWRQQ